MMHFIATAITDPAKLVQLPFILFKTASTFAIVITQQSIDFASDMLKIIV